MIVDNVAESFQMQPDNGIFIKSWYGDINDNALLELLPLLVGIAKSSPEDVRMTLQSLRDKMIQEIINGNPKPHLNLI